MLTGLRLPLDACLHQRSQWQRAFAQLKSISTSIKIHLTRVRTILLASPAARLKTVVTESEGPFEVVTIQQQPISVK